MKSFIRKNIGKTLALLLVVFTACQEGEEIFDQIRDAEQRGAILRTVNLISNELPIGIADAGFAVEIEEQDQQNGDLLASVEVFVGFNDNTVEDGAADLDVTESLYSTIAASTFTTGEFGLPRTTIEITLAEMLSFTGVQESDLLGGDSFSIRLELILTDGRRFSNDDNSGTITGSYFSSPFLYTPTVVCPVGEEQFVGEYMLMTDPISPVGGVPTWNTQTVTLSIGETSTQRLFSAIYLEGLGFTGANDFSFDLVCGNVNVPGGQSSGLACVTLISFGPADGVAPGSYDPADDSTFTIVFAEDETNDCGGGVAIITATLTKV